MILGLGVDLVDLRRFEREIARCPWSREDAIFTEAEIRWCAASRDPARQFAMCFAAKEALLKAMGTGAQSLAVFCDVEIWPSGRELQIVLHHQIKREAERLGMRNITLSIAATKKHTGAMVIAES